jgi:hypothetical protein
MRILVFCLLLFPLIGDTNKGEPITIHVKEVHRTQDEGTDKGQWSYTTAIAETKTIIYTIKCGEYLSIEKNLRTLRCFQISAGKDYPVRRFITNINFWQDEPSVAGQLLALYTITDEKEK